MQDTADGADTASESVDGLADSYAGLGDSADSAKKSLLDIDTLNVFGGSESTGGVDFAAVAAGAEGASDVVAGLTNDLGGLSDELDNLNNFSLDGLGSTFSTTFSDIGTGFSTLLDAFNFDSDTQLSSLRVLDKKVRDLFGDDWSDFWTNVGSTMYRAFGENNSEYDRCMALTDIHTFLKNIDDAVISWTGDFGKGWSEFWQNVGAAIAPSIREGLGGYSIEGIISSVLSGGMATVNSNNWAAKQIAEKAQENATSNNLVGNFGGGGGRVRGLDTSQYQYADYSSIQQSPSAGIGQILSPEELSSRLRAMENGSVINLNLTMQNEIDLDGDKVGESVTTYQSRENARSNGY